MSRLHSDLSLCSAAIGCHGRGAPDRVDGDLRQSEVTDLACGDELGGGRTEVITHQTNVPEMYRAPEAVAGMTSSFDRFDAYLVTIVDRA